MKDINKELDNAILFIKNNEFDKAINELKPYLENSNPKIKSEANNLTGQCFLYQENYLQAVPFYKVACEFSKKSTYHFNLAVALTLSKSIKNIEDFYEKAIFLIAKDSDSLSIYQMRFYFACALVDINEYVKALEQLNYVWEQYILFKITDHYFLYIRNMFSLEVFFEKAIPVLNKLSDQFDGLRWLEILKESVDKEGQLVIENIFPQLIAFNIIQAKNFTIPLPLHPKFKPLKGLIEDIHEDNGLKYIVCRIFNGTLKKGLNICLEKNKDQLLTGKVIKIKFGEKELKELLPGDASVVYFSEINPNDIAVGDAFYESLF